MTRRAVASAVAIVGLALPMAALTSITEPATAATNDQSVSGVASPMWQTNGTVESLATGGGVIYAGGTFTKVRPPGAAAGSNETTRTNLAAFNASTGALITSFNVSLNGVVNDLALSPDGTKLYAVGAFTSATDSSGTYTRNRVVAISLTTGRVDQTFVANAGGTTSSVTATNSTVYVSGIWNRISNVARTNLAALNATTGAALPAFTTTLDSRALRLVLSPDGSRLLVGGNFTTVNGQATGVNGAPLAAMASLDPTTGAIQQWDAGLKQPINTNCTGRVTDIAVSGSTAYVTAEGDAPGCYEGSYAATIGTGALQWNATCLGASQALALVGNVLYRGDHQHDCAYTAGGAFGGFVGGTFRDRFVHRYLTAQNVSDGSFVHWTPNTNASGSGAVGPHAMTTDGSQVIVGGDFTRVNGTAQQGLTRFTSSGNQATPLTPGVNVIADPWPQSVPGVASNLAITVQPTRAGTLTVQVPTVEDADNGTLTYRIFRDNGTTPVSTQTAESYPWSRPVIRFDDAGLAAGSTHSYRVTASDGVHTSARSTAVSGTVAAAAPPSLSSAYTALSPQTWWRLGDTGDTAADSASGGAHPGTFQGGVSTAQSGVGTGNTGVTLDGSTGYVNATSAVSEPGAFSESAWFKTTTVKGGVITAQSDTPSGAGGNTDRLIAMDNNGGLVFSVKAPATGPPIFGTSAITVRNQGPIFNDGRWHLAVGTYDGNGTIAFYVDGALQGSSTGTPFDATAKAVGMPTSYQRAGYADLSQFQLVFGINFYNQKWPASEHFSGSIDEVTNFDNALTAAQARSMFAAGVGDGA